MGAVYNTAGGGTGGTTMNLTFNAGGTPAGRSLVVWVSRESGYSDSINFSLLDNKTNAYVATLNVLGSNGSRLIMWVCPAAASGTSSIGITASGSPVRFSAGIIECDLLNGNYYDFLEVSKDELAATSTTHQCGPDPGITTGANDVLVLALGQGDGAATLGTLTMPSGFSTAFVGTTLPSIMASFRATSSGGSGERGVWSHTGSNRRCNNAMHAFLFNTTANPAYVAIPDTLAMLAVPRQPAISTVNRVIQAIGANQASGLTLVVPLTQPVSPKTSLISVVCREGSADRSYTTTDNGGGTWSIIANPFGTGGSLREVVLSVCTVSAPGTTSVTITPNVTGGGYSAMVIECDALHPTLFNDIQTSVNELVAAGMTHNSAGFPGLSSPNNVLSVIAGATGANLFTTTPPAGYNKPVGATLSSAFFAYRLYAGGFDSDMGTWTQTNTPRACINLYQSLLFNGQAAQRLIRPPAMGSNFETFYLATDANSITIINEAPSTPVTITLPAISMTLTPQPPTWAVSVDLTFPVIPMTLTARAPAVLAGRNLPVPVLSLTLVPRDPTLLIGRTIQLPALVLILDAELPSLTAIQQISLARLPLTLTSRAPTLQIGTTVSLPALALTLQPQTPTHITNDQMLRLTAIPMTLQPQASHINITVELLRLPAIPLYLNLLALGKVDTGFEPPQVVEMEPLSLTLPMFVNTDLGEGPTTAQMTNLSLQLPMLSGARMM